MPSHKLPALALAAFVAAATSLVIAQDVAITPDASLASLSPEEMVAKRQSIMKEDGGILRSAGGLSGAEAVTAAEHLITNYSNLTILFPEGSAVGDTKAAPAIWERNADFQAILAKGVGIANEIRAAAEAGDAAAYGAALKSFGATCAECHQQFRIKS